MYGWLSFGQVTRTNRARCERWHPGYPEQDAWTLSDWSNALAGEVGEACNIVKKLRRAETGVAENPNDPSPEELVVELADELADVFIYLDLLATRAGIDLVDAVVSKFNIVSDRQDFPERLP